MQMLGLAPIKAGGFAGPTPFHYSWSFWGKAGGAFPDTELDVVGVIPGTDPALGGQYVFVTAHFDHLGVQRGTLYPGADDNASGTAGMLEIMRLLRHARPRRTLAFLGVSGEEEGLLGSGGFLADPPVPRQAMVADLNLDMIGRGRPGELHVVPARQPGYVTTLTRAARTCAAAQGVALSAGMDPYWPDSDHYSFAQLGIPSLWFTTGLHADYHQPTDTPDKINGPGLAQVVRIVRDLALATANADAPPAALPEEEWKTWTWGPYPAPREPLSGYHQRLALPESASASGRRAGSAGRAGWR
jgi:Zn-dependent M28 family amino/carboxypeptidase